MRRRKRNLVIPIVATVLAVAAFAGVVELQHRANGYQRAQSTLNQGGSEFAVANVSPLEVSNHVESVQTVARTISEAETSTDTSLAGLKRDWPIPDLALTAARVTTDFKSLNTVAQTLFRDPQLQSGDDTLTVLRYGAVLQQESSASIAAIQSAVAQYQRYASRAQTEAFVGTALALALLLAAFFIFFTRWAMLLDVTHRDARSDALTGLRNRRALIEALERELPAATEDHPLVLTLYDLDGFKAYNDSFGHLAGDALLARFAQRLTDTVGCTGTAYRMGGDEFCGLVSLAPDEVEAHIEKGRSALTEVGESFEVGCSAGCVRLPSEATSPDAALALADQRMYERKAGSARSAARNGADVLFEMVAQRVVSPSDEVGSLADLAGRTAEALDLPEVEVKYVRLAAELHDVGKSAIPEEILSKPSALNEQEWAFIRDHTIIGERIVRAAPDLAQAARLIRSSHERTDGSGYPDGLAGDAIPIGARIVAVCDALEAMIASRAYRPAKSVDEALAELRGGRGTQFDPRVVDAVCDIVEHLKTERLAA